MKKGIFSALALTLTMLFGSNLKAQGVEYVLAGHSEDKGCGSCGDAKCDGPSMCCGTGCSSWQAEFEALMFRYNRAEGVRVGAAAGDTVDFNYEFAPRITVGWITANGLGIRGRYFDINTDQSSLDGGGLISVNTTSIDLEVFEIISLTDCTTLEWSAGLRYNDFREVINGAQTVITEFDGFGLIFGLEANRQIRWGSLFARSRLGLLVGDAAVTDAADGRILLNDATQGMIEVAIGWETSRVLSNGMLATVGVSYEMQNWFNYSTGFDTGVIVADADGREDVGFDGAVFSFAIER